jgi:hypothetical protein
MGSAGETKGKLKEAAGSVTGSDDLRKEGPRSADGAVRCTRPRKAGGGEPAVAGLPTQ